MIFVDLDRLKSNIAEYKDEINKVEDEKRQIQDEKALLQDEKRTLEKEQSALGKKFQEENMKKDAIVDKESAVFQLKQQFVQKVLENLREKNAEIEEKDTEIRGKDAEIQKKEEQIKDIKEKAQNEIDNIKGTLEKNKEEWAQNALFAQEKKKSLEKEKEYFENLIRADEENSTIKNDDQIMQNRRKKVLGIEQEMIAMDSKFSECIKEMDDIDKKLEFINYDKIQDLKTDKEIIEERLAEEARKREEEEARRALEAKQEEERRLAEERLKREQEEEAKRAEEARQREEEEAKRAEEARQREEEEARRAEEARQREEEEARRAEEEYKKWLREEEMYKEWLREEEARRANLGLRKMSIEINEKNNMMHIVNGTDGKIYNIPNICKNKKDLFKRLNIKDMCKDVAGKGIASRLLYRKINPSIIQGLEVIENDPNLIKEYISAIHNEEELPFDLQHDLDGINILKKFKLRTFISAEQKSGALIIGKIFKGVKALNRGKDNRKEASAESSTVDYSSNEDELQNWLSDFLFDENPDHQSGRDKFAQRVQENIDNTDGHIEQNATESASKIVDTTDITNSDTKEWDID